MTAAAAMRVPVPPRTPPPRQDPARTPRAHRGHSPPGARATALKSWLVPDEKGWVLWKLERKSARYARETFPTVAAAANAVAAAGPWSLLLPASVCAFQTIRAPDAPEPELLSMARLKLEAAVPWTPDQFQPAALAAGRDGAFARLLGIAVRQDALATMLKPLTDRGLWPESVQLHAAARAASAPGPETLLWLFSELDTLVLMLSRGGRPFFLTPLDSSGDTAPTADVQRALWAAETQDLLGEPDGLVVDGAARPFAQALSEHLNLPTRPVPFAAPFHSPAELIPQAWVDARAARARARARNRLLALAGVGYGISVALFAAHVASLKARDAALDADLARLSAEAQSIQKSDALWRALAAGAEPSRFMVEHLFALHECLPADGVHLTSLVGTGNSWTLQGEAGSLDLANEFAGRVKASPAFKGATIDTPPPGILPEDRASFSITVTRHES